MMKLNAGPKPDTMNVNNSTKHGASYGIDTNQKSTIPNEIVMQMDLGPERKIQKYMRLAKNPHIAKNIDFSYGRDDPAKYDRFAIENKRKSERDEGVSVPYSMIAIMEKKQSPIISTQEQNPTMNNKKASDKDSYGSYNTGYGTGYGKKEEQKPVYLSVVKGGKSKIYSSPADNVAARVEELSEDYKPKLKAVGKAAKALYNLFKSAYSAVISKYENIKHKGYTSNENVDETENQYVDNVVNIADFREQEESELELLLKAA